MGGSDRVREGEREDRRERGGQREGAQEEYGGTGGRQAGWQPGRQAGWRPGTLITHSGLSLKSALGYAWRSTSTLHSATRSLSPPSPSWSTRTGMRF